jgi:hypothetical protein
MRDTEVVNVVNVGEQRFIGFVGTVIMLVGICSMLFQAIPNIGLTEVPPEVTVAFISGMINLIIGGFLTFTEIGG